MKDKNYRLSAELCALKAEDADKLIAAGDGDAARTYTCCAGARPRTRSCAGSSAGSRGAWPRPWAGSPPRDC